MCDDPGNGCVNEHRQNLNARQAVQKIVFHMMSMTPSLPMDPVTSNRLHCWLCGSDRLLLSKSSNLSQRLDSMAFQITDARYGVTGSIYRCVACGFYQCSELDDVLGFYETMNDEGYESTRSCRALQARELLKTVASFLPNGRLLDIGAGSGILVEEALSMGYAAEGIEPSQWLWRKAVERQLKVHHGILPHEEIQPDFDIVCMVDVIEHVPDPLGLLREAGRVMSSQGVGVVVTPDVGSIAARMLGSKWWHYRTAHIGYFNQQTLTLALSKAGFVPIAVHRPSWYFPLDYLLQRLLGYLKIAVPARVASLARHITVPLNLRDSLLVVFRKGQS
jgi:2-polyprenyl-3-methyl-5-hydroxy-6-metoxy-1,4-benzoquinol methylase